MSTRAQIEYEGMPGIYIYQHCDGYPSGKHGMLAKLKPLMERLAERLGDDEYVFARLIQGVMADSPEGAMIGYGVGQSIHGDIDHFYHVSRSLEVTERPVPTT